jgi:hypothetical protein
MHEKKPCEKDYRNNNRPTKQHNKMKERGFRKNWKKETPNFEFI